MATNIGKRVFENLNKQVTDEMATAYTFLSMSGVFSDMGLNGCAKWARSQFEEKIERSLKIFDHILLRGAKIKFLPIPVLKHDWRAPLHIFEEVVRIEQRVTTAFAAIADISIAEKDHGTANFVKWFVDRQVEKEAFATYLLDRLRKMQSTDLGVLMFDKELADKQP